MLASYPGRLIRTPNQAARLGMRLGKLGCRSRRGLVAPFTMRLGTMLLGTTLLVGCGSAEPASLAGKVQFNGEPVAAGTVTFHPLGDTEGTSAGAKIKDGNYSVDSAKGLMPGEYRVAINAWKDTGEQIANPEQLEGEPETIPETVQLIPAAYNQKSTLKISLKSGSNEQNFSIAEPSQIADQAKGEPAGKPEDEPKDKPEDENNDK